MVAAAPTPVVTPAPKPEPQPEPVASVPPPLLPPPLVGPRATIEVCLPDGSRLDVAFDGAILGVGRGTDNDIVIPDERVSRHHGRFSARHGTLVYTDLGSTNGSLVGGVRVREVALGAGDVVRLGRATLTVRPRP
ncbi:MAG: FHA domain-containing protein [Chloroflexota bacterium]